MGRQRPRALRIVRAAPAVLVVERVAQRVEGLLPARRRDVQALARLEVAARGQDVDMHPAAPLAVQHGRHHRTQLLRCSIWCNFNCPPLRSHFN